MVIHVDKKGFIMSTRITVYCGLTTYGAEFTGYDGERFPVELEIFRNVPGDQIGRGFADIDFDIMEPQPVTINGWFLAESAAHGEQESVFFRESFHVQDVMRVAVGDTLTLQTRIAVDIPERLKLDFKALAGSGKRSTTIKDYPQSDPMADF